MNHQLVLKLITSMFMGSITMGANGGFRSTKIIAKSSDISFYSRCLKRTSLDVNLPT